MATTTLAQPTSPVGRRLLLKILAAGAAGLALGPYINPLSWLGALGGGLAGPANGLGFRIYTVNGIPKYDPATFRLALSAPGSPAQSLSIDDVKALPQTDLTRDFRCVTGWVVKNVTWTGVQLSTLLQQMGVPASAAWVSFYSADGQYVDSLSMAQATQPTVLVAHSMNGQPLPAEQGAPLRVVIPEMYGYKGTKWLNRIEAKQTRDIGYWEQRGYPADAYIRK